MFFLTRSVDNFAVYHRGEVNGWMVCGPAESETVAAVFLHARCEVLPETVSAICCSDS